MPFMVSGSDSGTTFAPAPEGTHQAVCVDIIDQGMKPNPFKNGALQHKFDIAWQVNELRDDGKRFIVYKRYTASLNEKATLRHDLESWRGRPFTATELFGFDMESVIGANCLLNVIHKQSTKDPSKTFANVAAVMPLVKGMPKMAAKDYERKRAAEETSPPPSDDDGPDFGPTYDNIIEEPPF
jgi:hypothetical protein